MDNRSIVENLRWKKFPVLNDGFVCLVDVMGDDPSVVQAARVSYGKDSRDDVERFKDKAAKMFPEGGSSPYQRPQNSGHNPGEGLIPEEVRVVHDAINADARTLIRYLMRHRHTTPFEMAELKFLVRVPMDCWRQWIRHRTANVNEYSTRYTEAIDSQQKTSPDEWRLQAKSNKQGSGDFIGANDDFPDGYLQGLRPESCGGLGEFLSEEEKELQILSAEVYHHRLDAGVAKEQARKGPPVVNVHRSLLEDRSSQPASFSWAKDG